MANVIIRRYNTFFDHVTNVQFDPVVDRETGLYIGLAVVSDDLVPYFSKNSVYEIVSDDQLSLITTGRHAAPGVDESKLKADIEALSTDFLGGDPAPPK